MSSSKVDIGLLLNFDPSPGLFRRLGKTAVVLVPIGGDVTPMPANRTIIFQVSALVNMSLNVSSSRTDPVRSVTLCFLEAATLFVLTIFINTSNTFPFSCCTLAGAQHNT